DVLSAPAASVPLSPREQPVAYPDLVNNQYPRRNEAGSFVEPHLNGYMSPTGPEGNERADAILRGQVHRPNRLRAWLLSRCGFNSKQQDKSQASTFHLGIPEAQIVFPKKPDLTEILYQMH
ncbi:MAG: hypothetical protein ACE10O_07320, partial [Candidatus Acidiferrales bacterium]